MPTTIDFHVPIGPPFLGQWADYSVVAWLFAAPFEYQPGPAGILSAPEPEVDVASATFMVYDVYFKSGGRGRSNGRGSMGATAGLLANYEVSSLAELFRTQFPPPGPD